MTSFRTFRSLALAALVAGPAMLVASTLAAPQAANVQAARTALAEDAVKSPRTSKFEGAKANSGYATITYNNGSAVLALSEDFVVPNTPAPHWQLVDSSGNTYLLNRLVIKGDKYNKTLAVPAYVKDVSKVQIWCAYAEVLLGEASFPAPVAAHMSSAGR
jgi:hypothetical protein